MKTIFTKLIATISCCTLLAMSLPAQTNEPLEAETEAPAHASDDSTNLLTTPTPRKPVKTKHSNDNVPVRIDTTGIHVGGESPVDIAIPRGESGFSALIPIVALLTVFGMPVAIVGLAFYFRHRKTKMLHETVRLMVEKGVPIPPELFSKGQAIPNKSETISQPPLIRQHKDLRNGLILVGIGIGVTIVAGKVGWIITLIGFAMLITWYIESKK